VLELRSKDNESSYAPKIQNILWTENWEQSARSSIARNLSQWGKRREKGARTCTLEARMDEI